MSKTYTYQPGEHRPECYSWLPEEPPCTCENHRLVIVAPSMERAMYHLRALGRSNGPRAINPLVVVTPKDAERLRGYRRDMREPGRLRLEVVGYPDSPIARDIIQQNLRLIGFTEDEM